MIRLLNPLEGTDAKRVLASRMLDRIHKRCSGLAAAFRAGPARYFIDEDISLQEELERYEILEGIKLVKWRGREFIVDRAREAEMQTFLGSEQPSVLDPIS